MNRLLTTLLALGAYCFATAQRTDDAAIFQPIPAAEHPITAEGMPSFAVQIPIGQLHEGTNYGVRLEYPELTPLTRKEVAQVDALGFQSGEHPAVEQFLGTSRGEGYLDVSFVPIVKRNGRWWRINSVKATLTTSTPAGITTKSVGLRATEKAARYAAASVLATGRWVKIRVQKEGVYELTQAKLGEMGFRDISRVKLYGYGGRILSQNLLATGTNAIADDLEEIPLYRKAGSVLFFAEGTVRWNETSGAHQNNHYSRYSYYFVTEGENPLTIKEETVRTNLNVAEVRTVTGHALLDNDAVVWYEGGSEMYDSYDFANGNQHTFRLNAPGATGPGKLMVAFTASNSLSATTAVIDVNGERLGVLTVRAHSMETESARETRTNFTTEAIKAENSFTFTTTRGNHARLNFIRLNYDRALDAAAAPFAFVPGAVNNNALLCIANANATTKVWRLGTPGTPMTEMSSELHGKELQAKVLGSVTTRYVVVDVGRNYDAPEVVGEVANQNLHGDGQQDMVIIIPQSAKLLTQAERLAAAHREHGLRVRILRADEIYNEFSSGTPDATAYRRYLKMLYDRAESEEDMPRYLLLFGDCAWDNRMLSNEWSREKPEDYLLAYEVSPTEASSNSIGSLNCYVTDDYFGLLDDSEGTNIVRERVDVGIGRFPCHDAKTAEILVDKTLYYMQNHKVGAWKNRVIMMADSGDDNLHMKDCEKVVEAINTITGERILLNKVYWEAYTQTSSGTGNTFPQVTRMLQQDIQTGALMFNYTGHGSPLQISHKKLLQREDFAVNTDLKMPLWVFASCEITPYDSQAEDIGRTALFNANGGAAAVICASRSVYANYNRGMNIAICENIFGKDAQGARCSLGDAIRRAKVALVDNSTDRSMNKMKYVLLGDPALALTIPEGSIAIDSVDGVALQTGDYLQLKAGQKVRFSGHVLAEDGTEVPSFRGEVYATLYDREETITCKNNSGSASSPMVYQDRTKKLFEGADSVRDGKFSIWITIPRDISYSDDCGRIYFYAVNNEHTLECNGFNEQFHLSGTDTAEALDEVGPKVFIYLNSPDFPDGGYVGTSALFGASISDDAGINTSGISIGHDIELILDGATSSPTVLNSYFNYDFGSYTSGTITYPLENLTPGKHELALRAWDINDNSTTARLTFNVRIGVGEEDYDVNATQNPAVSQTSFVTTLQALDNCSVLTEVFDLAGRLVWQHEGDASATDYFSTTWDLRDSGGHPVNSGVYIYRATVRTPATSHETKSKKMIIVRQ
ncbi:MAG: type IX secretion system sortase PorU [Alloprevotella sp.]|nr:type IX secretion system sortase PorU [Alloprevotella sp.]